MSEIENGETPLDPQLRERLRAAMDGETSSPELAERIRAGIAAGAPAKPWTFWLWQAGIAAALLLCLGSMAAYRQGYLRLTTASRIAYIDSISKQVAAVMRPGLNDHVNCAYFGKHASAVPSPESFTALLGPGYQDLLWTIPGRVPPDYQLIEAHRCGFRGRHFVHLTFRRGHSLLSLVISRREEGESLEWNNLMPALSGAGLMMYQEKAQRFQIAAFETPKHLVYVVSDLPASENLAVLRSVAEPVRAVLRVAET